MVDAHRDGLWLKAMAATRNIEDIRHRSALPGYGQLQLLRVVE